MKKLFYLISILFFASGVAYASFPVKNVETTRQETISSQEETYSESSIESNETSQSKNTETSMDEKVILLLLWFFLGVFAAHRWYAGKPVGYNILFILTLGGCGIWAIVDLINILTDNF